MRRYFYDHKIDVGQKITIDGDLFKHIFRVCRLGVGAKFELLIQNGGAYLVQVESVDKNSASVFALENREVPNLKEPHLHLVLANPKPSVLESVIEKSVELGVKSIFLVSSENSFFKSLEKIKLKEKRLKKIITQALQQSGRLEPLELQEAMTFEGFLNQYQRQENACGFMLYEALENGCFEPLTTGSGVKDLFLLVGGEGGFSNHEAELAKNSGFKMISLGPQILRVETACVAGISILKSAFETW